MIEIGKNYKLKKIKNFPGVNSTDEYKIHKIVGEVAYCENTSNGEINCFNIDYFIDPEHPDDIYSTSMTVLEKFNPLVLPMNLNIWKEIQEEASFGGLGAAPCPAISGGLTVASTSGCTVNGVPVEGQSVKDYNNNKNNANKRKKKKDIKKNEGIDTEFLDSPKQVFSSGDSQDREIEYEDALNLLLYGQDELDKKEYTCMLKFFKNCNVLGEFKKFAKEKGIDNISPNNVGSQLTEDLTLGDETKSLIVKAQAEENEAISSYLDKAKRCEELGIESLAKLFRELADDEKVHTGCLQGALDNFGLSDIDKVLDGQEEAEEILNPNPNPETGANVDVDVNSLRYMDDATLLDSLEEEFHEEYEQITEQIAKYLDRLNFQYANTTDIVYKKEGDYKYLFKFDNQEGIIKVKVLKGEDTLVDKEYKIDETQDIQPIFDEIENIYRKYGL